MKIVLALAGVVLFVSAAEAQRPAWCNNEQCRITAKTCSSAKSQCYRIQTTCGAPTAGCDNAYARCIENGTWAGRVCNLTGLTRR
jgi:hypothetical protein